MKKPTSKDVAALAGVSQSTVSLVLNNRKHIVLSEQTQKKVLDAAKELGYSLSTRSGEKYMGTIGLMFLGFDNLFHAIAAHEITKQAQERGYHVFTCNSFGNEENEKKALAGLSRHNVSGIIYTYVPRAPGAFKALTKSKMPAVIIGETNDFENISTVSLNSEKSAQLIVEHLVGLGHKSFALLSKKFNKMAQTRANRAFFFKQSLEKYGLQDNLMILESDADYAFDNVSHQIQMGCELTERLIINKSLPTAIVGSNDMLSIGALHALRKNNISVPSEVSVCGFDNNYIAEYTHPSLTTVDAFLPQRCKIGTDLLLDSIEKRNSNIVQMECNPLLVERDSTGLAKGTAYKG